MTRKPMTAEQFIAQLDELAKVEHALCVEYLSVHCALGHDRDPGPDASAHEQAVHDAARAAMNLAMDEMRHLHGPRGSSTRTTCSRCARSRSTRWRA